MMQIFIKLIACHLIGDYVLQSDYLATTKGNNAYHLCVHSFLYAIPFYFVLGWGCIFVFSTHIVIDGLKAHYKVVSYSVDQILHYLIAFGLAFALNLV